MTSAPGYIPAALRNEKGFDSPPGESEPFSATPVKEFVKMPVRTRTAGLDPEVSSHSQAEPGAKDIFFKTSVVYLETR